ncbi:MAG: epimerase [Bacteroidia bacterium]|nr:epimerase [Bacteroidia bacterium]
MLTLAELENQLSLPSPALLEDITHIPGDFIILGAGGKMGPSLVLLLRRAIAAAGSEQKITAVSRFSEVSLPASLRQQGIETISADLLREADLAALPLAENVIYMAGMKFGSSGNQPLTWAMNSFLPGRVAEKYKHSNIVVFSTGNVYPFTPAMDGGPDETTEPQPIGEYAQSCLGRERIFEYFSQKNDTAMLFFRLNYAIDMRYGVLLDVAKAVFTGKPIDLSMGHVNVIWQGDANEMAIRSLRYCNDPPMILNVTGPETISVRWLAQKFEEHFSREAFFTGVPQPTALLSNASLAHRLFGYPRISLHQMIEWTADWVLAGGEELGKPTHFQQRKGNF